MISVLINVLAVIGGFTVACAILLIIAIVVPEIWRSKCGKGAEDAEWKIPTTCILNDGICPHDSEDAFLDCGECEIYEAHKNSKNIKELFAEKEDHICLKK